MNFGVKFPVANAIKFTLDGENTDQRASFDQQRFLDAVHAGMMERQYFQPFENNDPLRPQFYTNFPLSRIRVISCDTGNVVSTTGSTMVRQFTKKRYWTDAMFTSVNGKLFIYFQEGNTYTDDTFATPDEYIVWDGRLPLTTVKDGDVVRYNVNGTGFQFGIISSVNTYVPELLAEGYLLDVDIALTTPVTGQVEIRYNEKEEDLYAVPVDISSLEGVYLLRAEFGLTDYIVSYTSEPIDVQERHPKSLAIGYSHEGLFDNTDAWGYLYLDGWKNSIRVPSRFHSLNPAGDMEVYDDDYGTREQLRAVAHREIVFRAYNQPSWMVDKFNVIFGHDTIEINDCLWRPTDFGSHDPIEDTDLSNYEITLRQKNDRRLFDKSFDVAVTALFVPSSFTGIPAAGDVLVAQFQSNTGFSFQFTTLPDWISVDVPSFSDGDFVEFTVLENEFDETKSATITAFSEDIAGVTAEISFAQVAGEEPVTPDDEILSVDMPVVFPAPGGEVVQVNVTAEPAAQWQAVSSSPWITVPGSIQTGSAPVNITASVNNSALTRNGSVTFVNINNPANTITIPVVQQAVINVTYSVANNSASHLITDVRVGLVGQDATAAESIIVQVGSFPVMPSGFLLARSQKLYTVVIWVYVVPNGAGTSQMTITRIGLGGGSVIVPTNGGPGWYSTTVYGLQNGNSMTIALADT